MDIQIISLIITHLALHFTPRTELLVYLNLKIALPKIFVDVFPIGFFVVFRAFTTYISDLNTRLQSSNKFNQFLVHIFRRTFYSGVKY